MWGWGWNKDSKSAEDEDQSVDQTIDQSPDPTDNSPLPEANETDANGSEYSDEYHSLQANRQGILPSLTTRKWGKWSEDDLSQIQLRGNDYLIDRLKIDCGPPLFRLSHIDIFHVMNDEDKILHVAQHEQAWIKVMEQRRFELRKQQQANNPPSDSQSSHAPSNSQSNNDLSPPPYPKCRNCDPLMHHWHDHRLNPTLVINIVFPVKDIFMSLVQYYERRVPPADVLKRMIEEKQKYEAEHGRSDESNDGYTGPYCCSLLKDVEISRVEAFDRLLERFVNDNDSFRDSTLKIIPRVSEGGWVVKKGVGRVPAILGKKVKQVYYSSSNYDWNGNQIDPVNQSNDESSNQSAEHPRLNYIEIDADLATSRIAGQIVGLIKSYCKTIVVDMSFLFQGDDEEHLPESLIGGIRIHKADMDKVPHWRETCEENKTLFPPY